MGVDWEQTTRLNLFEYFQEVFSFIKKKVSFYFKNGFSSYTDTNTKTRKQTRSEQKVEWKQNGYGFIIFVEYSWKTIPLCKGYCLMTMVSHPRPTLPLTARESPSSSSSITCVRTFPLGSPSLIVSEEAISYIMAKLEMAKNIHLQL